MRPSFVMRGNCCAEMEFIMTERICFLGKGGAGRTMAASHTAQALAKKGLHVLLIGNDISLSTTLLLRGGRDPLPAMEAFREYGAIRAEDYIMEGNDGVLLMELGGIRPGAGCLARDIELMDQFLTDQGFLESRQIDYVLYDISGEVPCTGYVLPVRDRILKRCIIVSTGEFYSLTTANSILAGIVHASGEFPLDIRLLVNYSDVCMARQKFEEYSSLTHVPAAYYLPKLSRIENCALREESVFDLHPHSRAAKELAAAADAVTSPSEYRGPYQPMDRLTLFAWQKKWKEKLLLERD